MLCSMTLCGQKELQPIRILASSPGSQNQEQQHCSASKPQSESTLPDKEEDVNLHGPLKPELL